MESKGVVSGWRLVLRVAILVFPPTECVNNSNTRFFLFHAENPFRHLETE